MNKILFLTIIFILVSITIGSLLRKKKSQLLNGETLESKAVLIDFFVSKNSGATSVFHYRINDKDYYFDINKKFENLNIGDTVFVKYSIVDPTIAEVIE